MEPKQLKEKAIQDLEPREDPIGGSFYEDARARVMAAAEMAAQLGKKLGEVQQGIVKNLR